jgi:hypothetical protein
MSLLRLFLGFALVWGVQNELSIEFSKRLPALLKPVINQGSCKPGGSPAPDEFKLARLHSIVQ